jgi:cytochrome P450
VVAVRVWPWNSINSLLLRAGRIFDAGADIIELKGLPFRVYCFRNPEHIEQIFKDPQVGGTKNPKLLDRLKWAMPRSGVVLKGGQEWRERRRQVQSAFKSQKLAKFAGCVAPLVNEMLAGWKAFEGRQEGFDLSHEMHNLITRLAFKMYFSEDLMGSELDRIAYESHYIEFNFVRRTPLFIPTPANLKFKKYVHNLQRTLQALIDERRASKAEHDDLLATMVNLHDASTNQPWPDREIVAETFNVYIATCLLGTSLCWSLYLLSQNPEVQDRLRAEARAVLGDRLPVVEDLANMPYSEMVMDEILRRFPSSWGLPRLCEQGMTIGSLRVPPGSMVIPMVYFVHHHRGLWDDPQRFDPERFSPENRKKIGTFSYFPYGRGERTCLGVNLAPLIVRQILAMICRDYRVTFQPQHPRDPVIDIAFEIHPRDKMMFSIERC